MGRRADGHTACAGESWSRTVTHTQTLSGRPSTRCTLALPLVRSPPPQGFLRSPTCAIIGAGCL
jgi:hypothetical protein